MPKRTIKRSSKAILAKPEVNDHPLPLYQGERRPPDTRAEVRHGHNGAVVASLSGMHPGAFLSPQISVRHDKALQLRPNPNHEA